MATLSQPFSSEEDDEQNKQQNQSGSSAAPQVVSGTSSGVGTGANSPGTAPTPTNSGQFANLQKYMDANKDFNSQGGGLAGKVVNNINDTANQAQNQIQQSQQSFQDQSNAVVNPWQNYQQTTQQAVQDPYGFSQNQDNVNNITSMRDAQYTGPKSLQDLQGNLNQANLEIQSGNVNDLSNQAQNESGRFNLLRQMFNRPNYSSGQQNLDNLLLQNNPDQTARLAQTKQTALATQNALTGAEQQAGSLAQQNTNFANQVQQDTRGALFGAATGENQSLTDAAAKANADRQAQIAQTTKDLQAGSVNADELKRIGLDPNTQLFGVDLSKFMTPSQIQATNQTVANTGDYNKLGALQKMIGGTASPELSAMLAKYGDATQAGQFAASDPYAFNKQNALDAISGQSSAYHQQADGLQQIVDQASGALTGDTYVKGGLNDYLTNSIANERNLAQQQLAATINGTAPQGQPVNSLIQSILGQDQFNAMLHPDMTNEQKLQAATGTLNNMSDFGLLGGEGGSNFGNYTRLYNPATEMGGQFQTFNPGAGANALQTLLAQQQYESGKLNSSQPTLDKLKDLFQVNRKLQQQT